MENETLDLCIVGNGPAGMSAAVYAARYGLKQLIVGDLPGGLMTSAHKICNYPAFSEISGMELTENMQKQLKYLNVPQKTGRVVSIAEEGGVFIVNLSGGKSVRAKNILLATGTKHRHLGFPNEASFVGKGISYCATCDGAFYKGKTVAVVGGSDAANTSSLYLASIADKVFQIHRGNALRGEVAWIDQIRKNEKITILYETEVKELAGEKRLESVKLSRLHQGSDILKIDGLFIEIGSEPDPTLIKELALKVNDGGYIVTGPDQSTSKAGVWAAGDITTGSNNFRQIITACSEGAIAAESIFKKVSRG